MVELVTLAGRSAASSPHSLSISSDETFILILLAVVGVIGAAGSPEAGESSPEEVLEEVALRAAACALPFGLSKMSAMLQVMTAAPQTLRE